MSDAKPSDVRAHIAAQGGKEIATDTETSGLFADDGARVSTASIAWVVDLMYDDTETWAEQFDNVVYRVEDIAPGITLPIASVAWPFDQGTAGKPEDNGQPKLWPEAGNLDSYEWRSLLYLLESNDLVMHNAKFDCEKYRVGVRRWPGVGAELMDNVVWDSQNVNHLLWPLEGTSLKPTCARLFDKAWADEAAVVKKYLQKAKLPAGRWDLMPWDVIGEYAEIDARITLMLRHRQVWEIENNGAGSWLHHQHGDCMAPWHPVYDAIQKRLDVTGVLYRMERRGVPYDEVASREAGIECRKRAAGVAKGLPFGPTGEKAKKYFFKDGVTDKGVECLDLVPYAVTDKGAPSLTAEIVVRMVDDEIPHASKWAEYTRVTNAASMWYEGYADAVGPDGRLRAAFRQNGTRSSRFSVERINLQAIPQDYRLSEHRVLDGVPTPRKIIAGAVPDGWRLYELDLAQAELRVATMFAKCRTMEQMIRDGEDLHSYTTESLFPQVKRGTDEFFQWRQVGKRGNFSLCFGSGGKTFRKMVSKETGIQLSEPEAERIVSDWNALYPEFGRAIKKHMNAVEKRQNAGAGYLSYVTGERRWFQQYEEAHKAFNQRVQGNLGQFAIDWMLRTDPFLSRNGELQKRAAKDGIGEPGLVLTIHDSQVLLLPDDEFGQTLAAHSAQLGKDLWEQMFPGIPGDVDYHAWDK